MSYPTYFSDLPDLKYALSVNRAGNTQNIIIKDFFHLMKVRDDIMRESTLYNMYNVINGERPENISYKEYGDEQYYWVILQINNIVDYYNQWPLSTYEFEKFIIKKYGSWENAGKIRHFETERTMLPPEGEYILCPEGLVVPQVFSINDIYIETNAISYAEYEERLNKRKSEIFVLKKAYLLDYIRETSLYFRTLSPQESSVDISDYFR